MKMFPMLLFYTPLCSVPHPPVLLSLHGVSWGSLPMLWGSAISLSPSVYAEGHLQEFPLLVFLVERNEVAGSWGLHSAPTLPLRPAISLLSSLAEGPAQAGLSPVSEVRTATVACHWVPAGSPRCHPFTHQSTGLAPGTDFCDEVIHVCILE